jgi:SNF2 family DNA or RNA helicase
LRQNPEWRVQAPPAWRERAARQGGQAKLECPPLGELEKVLRPYQKQGVAWLHFLRENGFGGILADEMGLGKTLQTLAFLETVEKAERGAGSGPRLPHLIICPSSLVFNWLAEAGKFTPGLKVLALHGPDRRARFDQIAAGDIVLTSYALIRRDAELYRGLEFDTMVLDEAQHIKNRQTQNAQAVKAVAARHRLVLTGTPMENSVLDLWSILDFLMPGYLGTAQDFRERYELPITRDQDAPAQARLGRRLRPFLLRRLKKEVAADLPAKLEQVSFCELTAEQRSVYRQFLEAARHEVLGAAGPPGEAGSRMLVLSALLRLRQVCCDLRLLKVEGVDSAKASGKLDLFGELLEEVMDGGHRALVFSQFVSMLTLLRERLDGEGVKYCYLDGSTGDRGAVVEQFQNDPAIPVFLISLKAGGVGLNLTGADTVIHFDPWWNPAVEDQATDRAHRIGQTKVVTSYKLIARDTVEEKILALQQRKRRMIRAAIGDEEQFAAALSWEEIQELLA